MEALVGFGASEPPSWEVKSKVSGVTRVVWAVQGTVIAGEVALRLRCVGGRKGLARGG